MKVYLLPGLGANSNLYRNIKIKNGELHLLNWQSPSGCLTLSDYAKMILPDIDTGNPFIIGGSSMGGMVASEIAKIAQPKGVIYLGSTKTSNELPKRIVWIKNTIPSFLYSKKVFNYVQLVADKIIGAKSSEGRTLFYQMLKDTPDDLIKFGIKAITNWDNATLPQNYLHIHGEKDVLFPAKMIQNKKLINGAGHFLTFERGKEISVLIDDYIKGLG
jgi:pimeloyl-ACP methyl ester carboxylesterase